MWANLAFILIAFLMAASLVGAVGLFLSGRNRRLEARLLALSDKAPVVDKGQNARSFVAAFKNALPKVGQTLMPEDEGERSKLKMRLVHAGLYGPQAMAIFLGIKMVLMVAPALLGLIAGSLGMFPVMYGVLVGACASIFGSIGPSFWLDRKKKQRQTMLRRALPDACDLIVICMEGGLSLTGALRRVVAELRTAHPLLAVELNIVQKKVQLGEPLPSALTHFATRCDLQEMRSLASVVKSAEKFGSSMVKALQNYAEALRLQRQQRAEEMAQKAATKVLFPTLLFIFPSILIIILGPAAIKLMEVVGDLD